MEEVALVFGNNSEKSPKPPTKLKKLMDDPEGLIHLGYVAAMKILADFITKTQSSTYSPFMAMSDLEEIFTELHDLAKTGNVSASVAVKNFEEVVEKLRFTVGGCKSSVGGVVVVVLGLCPIRWRYLLIVLPHAVQLPLKDSFQH